MNEALDTLNYGLDYELGNINDPVALSKVLCVVEQSFWANFDAGDSRGDAAQINKYITETTRQFLGLRTEFPRYLNEIRAMEMAVLAMIDVSMSDLKVVHQRIMKKY